MTNNTVPKTCPECGGTFQEQTITHEEHDDQGLFYIVQNVPAWVCSQCGEIYLDADIDALLDQLIKTGAPVKQVKTPVYDFTQVKT